ncbi:MAG TPA: GNAT family N-acetyltransferase [Phaeodactylibacter sp.]|nr:GNAT family N-acetyltransferase [Phaeodactylibacter sp.]
MPTEGVFRIRPIAPGDNPAIARIIREVMTAHGASGEGFSIHDAEVDDMYGAYQAERSAYFVLERNGQVLGGAGIAPLKGGDEETCELKKMYFLPEARGKGLAKAIADRCLQAADSLGYRRCYLETITEMTAANRFYQRYGFQALEAPMGDTGHHACTAFYQIEW